MAASQKKITPERLEKVFLEAYENVTVEDEEGNVWWRAKDGSVDRGKYAFLFRNPNLKETYPDTRLESVYGSSGYVKIGIAKSKWELVLDQDDHIVFLAGGKRVPASSASTQVLVDFYERLRFISKIEFTPGRWDFQTARAYGEEESESSYGSFDSEDGSDTGYNPRKDPGYLDEDSSENTEDIAAISEDDFSDPEYEIAPISKYGETLEENRARLPFRSPGGKPLPEYTFAYLLNLVERLDPGLEAKKRTADGVLTVQPGTKTTKRIVTYKPAEGKMIYRVEYPLVTIKDFGKTKTYTASDTPPNEQKIGVYEMSGIVKILLEDQERRQDGHDVRARRKTPSPKTPPRIESQGPITDRAANILISCIGLTQILKNLEKDPQLLSYPEQTKIVQGVPDCVSKTNLGLSSLELLNVLVDRDSVENFDELALFGLVSRPTVIDEIVRLDRAGNLGVVANVERMDLTLRNAIRSPRIQSFRNGINASPEKVETSFAVSFLSSKVTVFLLRPETRSPTKRFFDDMQNLYLGAPGHIRDNFPGYLDFSNPNSTPVSVEKFNAVVEKFLLDVSKRTGRKEDIKANIFQPLMTFALKVAAGGKLAALNFAMNLSKWCPPSESLFGETADYAYAFLVEPNPMVDDQMFALSRILSKDFLVRHETKFGAELKFASSYLKNLYRFSFQKLDATERIFKDYVSFGFDVDSFGRNEGTYLKMFQRLAKKSGKSLESLGWVRGGSNSEIVRKIYEKSSRPEADALSFFTIKSKPPAKQRL